jgi:hypothetical protein
LLVKEKNSEGSLVGMTSNPGGRWEEPAFLKVHLRNDSPQAVFWSRDRDVWHVVFGAPGFTPPPAWPRPTPPPIRHGPTRLAPGEQAYISLNLAEAFDLWPPVEPGEYTVQVVYAPNQFLTFATGGEGHYTRPYDVPGFQKGTFVTPPIAVQVRHPWLSDADARLEAKNRGGGMRTAPDGRSIWLRRVKDDDLRFLSRVPKLKELELSEAHITDAGLAHLRLLNELERLDLTAPQVTDEGLVHLRGLTNLRSLSLHQTQITGPGLKRLRPLTNLRLLDLHDSPVTDEGIAHLACLANLRALSLWGTKATDDALKTLKDLPHLAQLNLWGTNVTDAGLAHLVDMKLQSLSLSGKAITNAGLVYVKQLDRLEALDLAVTQVTDEGIPYLQAMKTLRWLTFEGSGPTEAGIAKLRQALPQTTITGP